MITQIEKLDFKGKTIYLFNTYGSTGVGESVENIKTYAKGADVKKGFEISSEILKL